MPDGTPPTPRAPVIPPPCVGAESAVELARLTEFRSVCRLRQLSEERLRSLEAVGECTRGERRWNRLLTLKQSELATILATTARAVDGQPVLKLIR
jgi:hypothetical protein